MPAGSRKGGLLTSDRPTYKLHARLKEHARSIGEVSNLNVNDFHYRYVVVDDIWIPLGEALMIHTFAPVWNKVIDGFGIHTPGGNRPQTTSAWDTLHPGRSFVGRVKLLPNPKSQAHWIREVKKYVDLPIQIQEDRPTLETGEED
ncbi:MAG: Eco29kI family restriction endonuclease [Acidobacteriota bacterium]|nr:Eco29kI family restriction endonuclease [Acidobacteriota bacterium]